MWEGRGGDNLGVDVVEVWKEGGEVMLELEGR